MYYETGLMVLLYTLGVLGALDFEEFPRLQLLLEFGLDRSPSKFRVFAFCPYEGAHQGLSYYPYPSVLPNSGYMKGPYGIFLLMRCVHMTPNEWAWWG